MLQVFSKFVGGGHSGLVAVHTQEKRVGKVEAGLNRRVLRRQTTGASGRMLHARERDSKRLLAERMAWSLPQRASGADCDQPRVQRREPATLRGLLRQWWRLLPVCAKKGADGARVSALRQRRVRGGCRG